MPAAAAAIAVPAVAAVGLALAGIVPRFPPASGLDRLLVVAWPAACLLEAGLVAAGPRVRLVGRGLAAVILGGVVLYGSVHLAGAGNVPELVVWTAAGWAVWHVVARQGDAVTLTLAILATGLVTVFEGWLRGGIAAVPLAVAVAVVAPLCTTPAARAAAIAAGAAAFVGLLTTGRFFGGLENVQAAALAAAAVASGCPLPPTVGSRPRLARGLRLAVTVAVLAGVVAGAARDFSVRLRTRGGPPLPPPVAPG